LSRRTSVALDIVISPGIEVEAIERDSLLADWDDGDARADFAVEAVFVHAEVGGSVTQADEARGEGWRSKRIGNRAAHAMNPETGVPDLPEDERALLRDLLLQVHEAKWASQKTRQLADRYAKQIRASSLSKNG
jgi:hypothetical protein